MLVLAREINQQIVIDTGLERIYVMVVDIKGPGVRLGIVAPHDVTVNRAEVQAKVDRERDAKGGAA